MLLVGINNKLVQLDDSDEVFVPDEEMGGPCIQQLKEEPNDLTTTKTSGGGPSPNTNNNLILLVQLLNDQTLKTVDPSFDGLFVAMVQIIPCTLTLDDQNSAITLYKSQPLAYHGLMCKHCGGRPGSLPNFVCSLGQTTAAQNMIKHNTHATHILHRPTADNNDTNSHEKQQQDMFHTTLEKEDQQPQ